MKMLRLSFQKKFKIYWFLNLNCPVSTWEARSLWTSVLRHNHTRNLLNKARLNQKRSKQNKIKPETSLTKPNQSMESFLTKLETF